MANLINLNLSKGDDAEYMVIVKNGAVAYDITASTLVFRMKNEIDDLDANSVITKTMSPPHYLPLEGKAKFKILKTESDDLEVKNYYYDIRITVSAGDVYTILEGMVNIKSQ